MLRCSEKIEFLYKEKDLMRQEILEFNRIMYRSLFFFITVFAVFLGLFLKKDVGISDQLRAGILILIGQLEIIIVVINIGLLSNQNIHCGYIRAIESKINELARTKLTLWETEMVRGYLWRPKSSSFWSNVFLYGFYSIAFIVLMWASYKDLGNLILLVFQIVEIILVILLLAFAALDSKRAEQFARQRFSESIH